MQLICLAGAAVIAAAGCTDGASAHTVPGETAPVRVDGSSTVYLVSKAVGEEVTQQGQAVVTVRQSGTTGGFKKLCAGDIDVSGASRPIQRAEIEMCKNNGIDFLELPIGYDGLAVAVSTNNTWVDALTTDELRRMWAPESAGKITSWRQIRASFPDRPLHLWGPGGDSGTFDYFTQAIVGVQRASRGDYHDSEDDTVLVDGIARDDFALGYLGYAYVMRNHDRLRAVPIDDGNPRNGDGAIAPSARTVANGTYQPLSRPIFIYVSTAALARPEVARFVAFYLKVARELSAEIGYVALPLRADQLARERFEARRTGTLFGGGAPVIGVTMEKLLDAQAQ